MITPRRESQRGILPPSAEPALPTTATPGAAPLDFSQLAAYQPAELRAPGRFPRLFTRRDLELIAIALILYVPNVALLMSGGGSALLYWLLAFTLFLVPSAIVTAKLARMFPREGAFYVWVQKGLGPFWDTLLGGFCTWWPPILLITSTGGVISQIIQQVGVSWQQGWLIEPWQQALVSLLVLVPIWALARRPFPRLQALLRGTIYLYLACIGVLALCAIFWLLSGHLPQTDFRQVQVSSGNLRVFASAILACLGIQLVLNVGGEIREPGAASGYIKRTLVLVVLGYLATWFALAVVLPQDPNDPFSAANPGNAGQVLTVALNGSVVGRLLATLVSLALCLFLLVSASAYSLVQSRLLVMAALDRRLPQRLAKVDQQGVPRAALAFQLWTTIIITLLLSGLAAGISSNADFGTILFNLVPASASVLWGLSSLTLFLVGLVLLARYSRYARVVGGPGNGLVMWCCVAGFLTTVCAIVAIFLVPWTPLLVPSVWLFWVGFLVLFSLAVGGVYSFVFAAEPADIYLLWFRAKQRAEAAKTGQRSTAQKP